MAINNEKIEELVSLYSLGILEESELRELLEYIKNDDSGSIKNLISENEQITSLLNYSTKKLEPPPELKDRLMQRIRLKNSVEKEAIKPSFLDRLAPFWYGLGGAAVAACALLLFFNYSPTSKYAQQKTEIAKLKSQIEKGDSEIDSLKLELSEKDKQFAKLLQMSTMKKDLVGYLENPNVVVIDLSNLKPDHNSLGRVLWNKNKDSAIFCALNLPQAPSDKDYQLWAIIDSKPVSYGIFDVNKEGNSIIKLKELIYSDNVDQFAVTLEPAGGVPQPTGEMYLAGES